MNLAANGSRQMRQPVLAMKIGPWELPDGVSRKPSEEGSNALPGSDQRISTWDIINEPTKMNAGPLWRRELRQPVSSD